MIPSPQEHVRELTDAEWHYVLAMLRQRLQKGQAMPQVVPGLSWDNLFYITHYHSVLPLFASYLQENVTTLDSDIRHMLEVHHHQHIGRSLFLSHTLLEILTLLQKHHIAAIVFKGPALASMLYQHYYMRAYVDLDIFIDVEDYPRASLLLQQQGYLPEYTLSKGQEATFLHLTHEMAFIKASQAIRIELHWGIFENYYVKGLDIRSLPTADVDLLGTKITTFSREVMFIILIAHGAKHCWGSLGWLVDIAMLLQQDLNWPLINNYIQQLGLEAVLTVALGLCQRLFWLHLPAELQTKPFSNYHNTIMHIEKRLREHQQANFYQQFLFNMQIKTSRLERITYLQQALTKPTLADWDWLKLPSYLTFCYRFVRPLRLLTQVKKVA